MKNLNLIRLLLELKKTYHDEKTFNFDRGIDAIINILSENSTPKSDEWDQAASLYRTMAGSKSGFSDVYIERDTAEQRVIANTRLDFIRQELWDTFSRV